MTDKTLQTKLVARIAWRFHRLTGEDFDDLFQEGCLAYIKASYSPNYDPARTKFITFAYRQVVGHLRKYAHKRRQRVPTISEGELEYGLNFDSGEAGVDERAEIAMEIEQLEPEARSMAELLLSAPESYASLGTKAARSQLKRDLHEVAGWPKRRSQTAIRDLMDLVENREAGVG